MLVGTGVACVTKDYGTGADCSLGRVEIDRRRPDLDPLRPCRDGQRHRHRARQPRGAHLGAVADEVTVAQIDAYDALGLVTSGDPYSMDQKTQDAAEQNPRWVPAISTRDQRVDRRACRHARGGGSRHASSSASACGRRRSSCGASRRAIRAPRQWAKARWQDGQLTLAGLAPLSLPALAATRACAQLRHRRDDARLLALGLVARALPARRRATGPPTSTRWRVRRGDGKFERLDRTQRQVSADRQQPHRHGVHVAVRHAGAHRDRARDRRAAHRQGLQRVRVRRRRSCPRSCAGRRRAASRWASATRCSSRCRPTRADPAMAQWNLGQYLIARGSDLPLRDLEIEMLPPLTPDEPPKGMAEVVMIPVVPALLNAIYDATGRRFQSLPVTQSHAQGSARVTTLSLTINGRAARSDRGARRPDDERLPARISRHDRHQVRLRRRAVPELRGDRRQSRRHQPHQSRPASSRRRASTASRSAPSRGTRKNGELTALQKAFIAHFAFQCGYCTAGFLNEGQVLLERLAKKPMRARRAGEDHRGGARRPSLPLHRLRQVSRGGARRDPRRSEALSPRAGGAMIDASFRAVATLAAGCLAAGALRPRPEHARAAGELRVDRRHRAALGRAIFTELGKVLTHPRCVNCHPAGDRPRQGDARPAAPAAGRARAGRASAASRCAARSATRRRTSTPAACPAIPNGISRRARWRGRARRFAEICEQIKDPARNGNRKPEDLIHHIGDDTLVGWAWAPGYGRQPAPGTQKIAGALVEAWVKTGAACPK